jgi:hypothetical protein
MEKIDILFYHRSCPDGIAAAWAICRSKLVMEIIPSNYFTAAPNVSGKSVVIVDFVFKKYAMMKILREAESVMLIDHHPSSKKYGEYLGENLIHDDQSSSCALSWKYFHPNEKFPMIFGPISDFDTKILGVSDTDMVIKGLYARKLLNFRGLTKMYKNPLMLHGIIEAGRIADKEDREKALELIKNAEYRILAGRFVAFISRQPNYLMELITKIMRFDTKNESQLVAFWKRENQNAHVLVKSVYKCKKDLCGMFDLSAIKENIDRASFMMNWEEFSGILNI